MKKRNLLTIEKREWVMEMISEAKDANMSIAEFVKHIFLFWRSAHENS